MLELSYNTRFVRRSLHYVLIVLFWSIAEFAFAGSKVVILGDSLTEGHGIEKEFAFPALLQKALDAKGRNGVRVINAGISGSTTASAESRLQWYVKSKPDIVILALGANDGLRGVPVKEVRKNLETAINLAKKRGIKVILAGMKVPPNYGKAYYEEFERTYSELAKTKQVPLIPFLLDGVAGEPEMNLPDGIHPNAKGHARIVANILPVLEPLL